MQCNYKTRLLLAYLVQDGSAKKHPFPIDVQSGSIKDKSVSAERILSFQYIYIYLNSRAECKHSYLHSNSLLNIKALVGHPERKPLQLYELTFDKRLTKYKQISEIKNKP